MGIDILPPDVNEGLVGFSVKDGAIVDEAEAGNDVIIVLDKTPFYAESGGQVADTGIIKTAETEFEVYTVTKTENGHGFGIRIIKEIVATYDGVVTFEDKGDEFEISLLIPQKVTVK